MRTCLGLVGYGPQDEELRVCLCGTPTVLAGAHHGEELLRGCDSADAFCIPRLYCLGEHLIHDGTTGFLVSTGNTTGFAERFPQLKDDPELRAKMGE
jgi:glycosyltransferase involved in cell wall biosynthesis